MRTLRRKMHRKCRNQKSMIRSVLVLLCVLACFFTACKKEPKQEGPQPTPTPEVVFEGFADADPALVKERAEEYAKLIAVTVGDTDISMQKAMFLIYSMEVQGNSYAAYYESQYGLDYWDMEYDEEGRTTREVFKEETIEALIQYAVLYDCAVKNGMELTYDETKENADFVEEIKGLMSAEEAERGGFTTDNLRETCAWMMLGEKYYGKMTDTLGVTEESVRKTIDKADYREYETEYLYLPTTYYDEGYNICQESPEVIESRKAQMQDCYDQVLGGATFEAVAATDETIVYNTRTFLAEGNGAEAPYMDAAVKLKVGEVCGPVETEYGVYIIRMLDDKCTKTYEATVAAEYEMQRNEAFQAAYEVLLEQYEVTVNEEVWEDILMGATVSILE